MALTQITTDGIKDGTITGTDLATNVDLVDNQKLRLGTGNDLEIFHDGSHSRVYNSTGALYFRSGTGINFQNAGGTETYLYTEENGAVFLKYDNATKFETTSAGATVTGSLGIGVASPLKKLHILDAGDVALILQTTNAVNDKEIFEIGCGGNASNHADLIFRTRVNAGTGGSEVLRLTNDRNVQIANDTGKLQLGASQDLQIYHDGSNSYIKQVSSGTGNLLIFADGHEIQLIPKSGEPGIKVINDAAVELYYNGSKKFETTSLGTQTFGDAQFEGNDGTDNQLKWDKSDDSLYFRDSVKAQFGTGGDLQIFHDGSGNNIINSANNGTLKFQRGGSDVFEIKSTGLQGLDNKKVMLGNNDDLQIYHDGSNSYAVNTGGQLLIRSTTGLQLGAPSGEIYFAGVENGAVKLYYDNSDKLSTTTWGVQIKGDLLPHGDNSRKLGESNERWSVVYAANGSINTSDRTEKNTIVESDLGLDFINKLKPISYKWNKDDGKTHYGLVVQDIEETILSLGKSITDFGGISKEEDSPMGLGYGELISPLIKAIQELSAEVAALKPS